MLVVARYVKWRVDRRVVALETASSPLRALATEGEKKKETFIATTIHYYNLHVITGRRVITPLYVDYKIRVQRLNNCP